MIAATRDSSAADDTLVVLLHGLWCNRLFTALLARRLRRCGFRVARFDYPSVRRSPAQNAAALARWLESRQATRIHFVAHSLGGLVLCHLFDGFPQPLAGRAVLLGTPLQGSGSAARLAALPGGHWMLGQSLDHGLLGDAPPWPESIPVGVIAGTVGVGLGVLLGSLRFTGDGAVAVSETQDPRIAEHLPVRSSHTGMLFSAAVARQVCSFLRRGHFQR